MFEACTVQRCPDARQHSSRDPLLDFLIGAGTQWGYENTQNMRYFTAEISRLLTDSTSPVTENCPSRYRVCLHQSLGTSTSPLWLKLVSSTDRGKCVWDTILAGHTSFPAGGFGEVIVRVIHVPGFSFPRTQSSYFSLAAIGTSGLGCLCPWRVRDPADDHVREGNEEWRPLAARLRQSQLNPMGVRATADPVFRATLVPRASGSPENLGLPAFLPHGVGHGVNSPIKDICCIKVVYNCCSPERITSQISISISNLI